MSYPPNWTDKERYASTIEASWDEYEDSGWPEVALVGGFVATILIGAIVSCVGFLAGVRFLVGKAFS